MVHSILTHHPAEVADAMMRFFAELGGDTRFCLAYGGDREEFEKIRWPGKFFLDETSLRGRTEEQNFSCWLKATVDWYRACGLQPEVVHFSENDHLPLRRDYWRELSRVLSASGRDFLGKWCIDRTGTNEKAYLHYRAAPVLLRHLNGISVHQNKTTLWGALADGMVFRREALEALASLDMGIPSFTEILIPSSLHHLGFALGDMDAFSTLFKSVRHRPEYLVNDVRELCSAGAWCCHPFKTVAELPTIFELVLNTPVRDSK